MDIQLIVICLLTFAIHLIGALAYAARIAGVRSGRIALSFSLFNILILVSRLSNGFLGPFLAVRIEDALAAGSGDHLLIDFRIVLLSATLATIAGTLLIPSAQRWFYAAITDFQQHRSVGRLLIKGVGRGGFGLVRASITPPRTRHIADLGRKHSLPAKVILLNIFAQALLTVGVVASLYAGYVLPDYRVTASQLSAVVNGLATIALFVFIDPQLSAATDEVVAGDMSQAAFRRTIVQLSISRIAGTIVAQLLLLPATWLIVFCAMSL